MSCRAPITVRGPHGNIQVACKQCLNCRIRRQSGLSLMALLEERMSYAADFWTLTYADAPDVLDYSDFSAFLKRYRQYNRRRGVPHSIRFLGVGEYGAKTGRPHFHALIFNAILPQSEASRTQLWPHGFAYIGTVTPKSIRYTARYCLKFAEKGQEGVAHWSQKPVLGAAGMSELAEYMKARGDKITEPPRVLRIEGRNYSVPESLQKVFMDSFGGFQPPKGGLKAHLDYLLNMKYGDPIEGHRRRQEEKAQFYETARFTSEKL